MSGFPYISVLIWLPIVAALALFFVRRDDQATPRGLATLVMIAQLVIVIVMWLGYESVGQFAYVEQYNWLPTIGATYKLGVDGLGLAMVALAAVIGLIASLAAFSIKERVRDFYLYMLLLQGGVIGVFTALDYLLFFVFWELVLIPMYFLIGIWGHDRREYAAIKFFIYTMVGSVLMMVSILAMYFYTGAQSFDMVWMADQIQSAIPLAVQKWIFAGFFMAFAVKVPVFPFHTWLPDAHVEAPTPISVILAAVLLKMGGYGFFRIAFPTLPEAAASFAYLMAVLGVINIIYGAIVALGQTDFKRVVAYSSVSHMGFVVLGLAAATQEAMTGAIYVMIAHGINSAMLFLLVGLYYDRLHTRDLTRMGGLFSAMPFASTLLAWAIFANLGLPGFSGFIGEFFTFLGTYPVWPALVYLGLIGLVFVTAYNLWTLQRVAFGPEQKREQSLRDANSIEAITLVPLAALTLLLGVYPGFIFKLLNQPVALIIQRLAAGF